MLNINSHSSNMVGKVRNNFVLRTSKSYIYIYQQTCPSYNNKQSLGHVSTVYISIIHGQLLVTDALASKCKSRGQVNLWLGVHLLQTSSGLSAQDVNDFRHEYVASG